MRRFGARLILSVAAPLAVLASAGAVAVMPAHAASGCTVSYSVTSQWSGGFGANVSLTNLGDPVSNWTVTWSFAAGQQVTQAWNATVTQSGPDVTAKSMSYNGSLATGAGTSFGFNGAWNGGNPVPAGFAMNGVACTGGTTTSPTPTPTPTPTSTPPPGSGGGLPSSLHWTDQGPLMSARPAAGHSIVSVKDPSIVRYNGQWLVYATTADTSGSWSLEYTHFSDFSQAATAPQYYLSDNPNVGTRYAAAPQLFYFAPKNKWFLVFQQGPPAYSTADDPTKPQTWSTPTNFFASEPPVVTQRGHGWLDFFVTCDTSNCYLFAADDAGDIFRSQTTLADFPNGFGNTTVVLHDDNAGNVFEGTAVYKVKGTSTYLMLVEGFDANGHRVYRAWTADSLSGSWTPYPASGATPFAGAANAVFTSGQWTDDVSHGELIRTGYDQNLEIDPCHLQFFYQGVDPASTGVPYSQIPWKLGLLTQTNPC